MASMKAGRAAWVGRMHRAIEMELTDRFPCGRQPRISDRLRHAFAREADQELGGIDLETVLADETPFDAMSVAEKLAHLDQLGVLLLRDTLRDGESTKSRNRKVDAIARSLFETRYTRIKRGDKQRSPLDALIHALAMV